MLMGSVYFPVGMFFDVKKVGHLGLREHVEVVCWWPLVAGRQRVPAPKAASHLGRQPQVRHLGAGPPTHGQLLHLLPVI